MNDRSVPRPIGDGVDRVLSSLGAPSSEVTIDVAARWVDIVGPQLARVTQPGSLRDGVLVVTTSEPAVADHLKWSERTVVAQANKVLGTTVVKAVRARVIAAGDS
jgi:predicted nucleic acid-binding Zn ribbon protein